MYKKYMSAKADPNPVFGTCLQVLTYSKNMKR